MHSTKWIKQRYALKLSTSTFNYSRWKSISQDSTSSGRKWPTPKYEWTRWTSGIWTKNFGCHCEQHSWAYRILSNGWRLWLPTLFMLRGWPCRRCCRIKEMPGYLVVYLNFSFDMFSCSHLHYCMYCCMFL